MSIREARSFAGAMERIESSERLKFIQDVMMPHLDRKNRKKAFRAIRKKASPMEERPYLSSEELAKRLSGMTKNGQ